MPPRHRAGLSRERVLQTALAIVDSEGIDALSMRRLGRELGVEAMSLYSYVRNKQDLIEGVVEEVFRELPLIEPGTGPWAERLQAHAEAVRAALLRHPNAVRLVAGRPLDTEGTAAYVESALVELQGYGLDLATADRVLGLLASFIIGSVAEQAGTEQRIEAEGNAVVEGATPRPGRTEPDRFPHVAAIMGRGDPDHDDDFTFGFQVIAAGIASLLSPAPRPAVAPPEAESA
jgi:AcrR family transcriptional regulator